MPHNRPEGKTDAGPGTEAQLDQAKQDAVHVQGELLEAGAGYLG